MPEHLDRCPVCACATLGPDYQHTDRLGATWTIFRCSGCGLGFLNPMPSWAELGPYYQGDYYAYVGTDADKAAEDEQLKTAAATGELRHAPITAGTRLLDVGCGEGSFIRLAARLGAMVEGIEPSELGVAAARRTGLQIFHGTAEQYVEKHGGERFDVITANHVLEHVHDPVRALVAMKSLLDQDGVLVIAVPNPDCYASRSLRGHWHSADLPRHVMQFGKGSLEEAGRRAGLRLDSLRTYSVPRAVASSLRAWLRRRLLVPGRLTTRVGLVERAAHLLSRRMDSRATGEALIAHFRRAPVPTPGDRAILRPVQGVAQAAIRNPVAPAVTPFRASV